jgi:predicted nuclease of predicted toxin-antitoxin system
MTVKVKLDENLPRALVEELVQLGHEVDTVPEEGMGGRSDHEIWSACQQAGRFLVTQDLDFSDIRRFRPGSHHGLLLVRLSRPGRSALLGRIRQIFAEEQVDTWRGCFVVASDRKVRIRRPNGS